MPTFNFIVPPSPESLLNIPGSDKILSQNQTPDIYTTAGPLALENGLVVTTNSMAFDPDSVNNGIFNCGVFGSRA